MIREKLKGFISGFLICSILGISIVGFAEDALKTIQVKFNSVNLKVNGKAIQADNILYNGVTYVPLRSVSTALNKNVGWNGDTNTASINDKDYVEPTIQPTTSQKTSNVSPNVEFGMIHAITHGEKTLADIYYTRIEKNNIGTPELKLVATNNENRDIDSFEFECSFTDSFGNPVYKVGTKDPTYKGVVQDAKLKHKDISIPDDKDENWNEYTFNLVLYDLSHDIDFNDIKITKVKYNDGTIWSLK